MRELFRRVVPFSWRASAKARLATVRHTRVLARARRAFRSRGHRLDRLAPTRFGDAAHDAQPVVMCLWRRPERLPASLRALAAQDLPGGVRLVLWNNDAGNDELYRRIIPSELGGALRSVELYSSDVNIGGAARMIVGRVLSAAGYVGPVVMIDDDQDVDPGFVRSLVDRWAPRTFAGTWAWRIHGDYWDRTAAEDGEAATYVGTGGSVADAALLADDVLAQNLDSPDLMCEDILLSARAHELGYRVVGADASFRFVEDEHDQWHALADAKSELYSRRGSFAMFPR